MTTGIITQGLETPLLLTQGFDGLLHATGGMVQGTSPLVLAFPAKYRDSLAGTPGTALEAHVPERGGYWIANGTNAGNRAVLDTANRVYNGSLSLVAYTMAATPASADQVVQADVVVLGRNLVSYNNDVTARFSTATITGYSAGYNSKAGLWHLSRWNNATPTALQSVSASVVNGGSYAVMLVAQGSVLSLYVNGSLVLGPYTDPDPILNAGNVGVLFRIVGAINDTDTYGAHLDNFLAGDANALVKASAQYAPILAGGQAQSGRALTTGRISFSPGGGVSLGGRQATVAEVTATPSGGMSQGSSQVAVKSIGVIAEGGASTGGSSLCVAQFLCHATGGVSQQAESGAGQQLLVYGSSGILLGGSASCSQAIASTSCVSVTLGGTAVSEGQGALVGGLITQGMGTGSFITQGYEPHQPTHYMVGGIGGTTTRGAAMATGALKPQSAGGFSLGASHHTASVIYHVYMNGGEGEPINYVTPIVAVDGLSWTSASLRVPGVYRFGVRAFSPATGLEEQNVDAVASLVLDEAGRDVTRVPAAPLGLRALPLSGGALRVEWSYACVDMARRPLGFHVYAGTVVAPDYLVPVATVPWSDAGQNLFRVDLHDMTANTLYFLGVRAFNAEGEETNSIVLSIRSDGTPPSEVDLIQSLATGQEA